MDGAGTFRPAVRAAGMLLLLLLVALSPAAWGEAAGAKLESIEIKPRSEATSSPSEHPNRTIAPALEGTRVVLALAVVIALILGVKWAGKRFLGLQAGASSGSAVQVLSRTVVSPRQQLMLVQVGKRLILVANCGTEMNPICEITDPEEVALVIGQSRRRAESADGASSPSFIAAFGRAGGKYNDEHVNETEQDQSSGDRDESNVAPPTPAELAGLLEKVRSMSGTYRRA